jgi:hypothetical protein
MPKDIQLARYVSHLFAFVPLSFGVFCRHSLTSLSIFCYSRIRGERS